MSGDDARSAIDRFLTIDPADAGCAQTLELIDAYVELVIAGDDPEVAYPGLGAHLRACAPCAEDFDGLLAAARSHPTG